MQHNESNVSFEDIPEEVLVSIFMYIHPADLSTSVNKSWFLASSHPVIWLFYYSKELFQLSPLVLTKHVTTDIKFQDLSQVVDHIAQRLQEFQKQIKEAKSLKDIELDPVLKQVDFRSEYFKRVHIDNKFEAKRKQMLVDMYSAKKGTPVAEDKSVQELLGRISTSQQEEERPDEEEDDWNL